MVKYCSSAPSRGINCQYEEERKLLLLTSLTVLNLAFVKLEDCSLVYLPSLKSLFLTEVLVEDEELHNLVLCYALSYVLISSSSLKFLEV